MNGFFSTVNAFVSGLVLAGILFSGCATAQADAGAAAGNGVSDPPPEVLLFADGDADPFADE